MGMTEGGGGGGGGFKTSLTPFGTTSSHSSPSSSSLSSLCNTPLTQSSTTLYYHRSSYQSSSRSTPISAPTHPPVMRRTFSHNPSVSAPFPSQYLDQPSGSNLAMSTAAEGEQRRERQPITSSDSPDSGCSGSNGVVSGIHHTYGYHSSSHDERRDKVIGSGQRRMSNNSRQNDEYEIMSPVLRSPLRRWFSDGEEDEVGEDEIEEKTYSRLAIRSIPPAVGIVQKRKSAPKLTIVLPPAKKRRSDVATKSIDKGKGKEVVKEESSFVPVIPYAFLPPCRNAGYVRLTASTVDMPKITPIPPLTSQDLLPAVPSTSSSSTSTSESSSASSRQSSSDYDTDSDIELVQSTKTTARQRAMLQQQPSTASTSTSLSEIIPKKRNLSDASQAKAGAAKQKKVVVAWQIQEGQCLSKRYKGKATSCTECTGRQAGYKCVFEGRRSWPIDNDDEFVKGVIPRFLDTTIPDDVPVYPHVFSEAMTEEHVVILKSVAATHLLATLDQELQHASRKDAVRWPNETKTRATCDGCMHTLIIGSWLCPWCGREFCYECCDKRKTEELDEDKLSSASARRARCLNLIKHYSEDFIPITRFDAIELERIGNAMRSYPIRARAVVEVDCSQYYHPAAAEQHREYLQIPLHHLDARTSPPALPNDPNVQEQLDVKAATLFHSLWAKGEPMVVSIIKSGRIRLKWTPEEFIRQFGTTECAMIDNADQQEYPCTVGSFFERFLGRRNDRSSFKIKDWPSTDDFKSNFPLLFEDFMNALPVGCVTRRDGVLNVAAHVPINSNPPDLGPKGYFSDISDESPGGNGTTKLHMVPFYLLSLDFDVADAVNIMMWSSMNKEDEGVPGVAAWDLFRAEDSVLIREFLCEMKAEKRGIKVETYKSNFNDPIHEQQTYLDSALLTKLYKSKGVRSWRIYQQPGDAVFIPAGCAHQVCNRADSIKIATDFISLENVNRCWKVSDEFREQTKGSKLWREDVLQLKSALFSCWRSCETFVPAVDDNELVIAETEEDQDVGSSSDKDVTLPSPLPESLRVLMNP